MKKHGFGYCKLDELPYACLISWRLLLGTLSPSLLEDYERIRAVAETTIAITEPDWVATAQREQLIQVSNHLIDPASAN